jgi:hypothetical protein
VWLTTQSSSAYWSGISYLEYLGLERGADILSLISGLTPILYCTLTVKIWFVCVQHVEDIMRGNSGGLFTENAEHEGRGGHRGT